MHKKNESSLVQLINNIPLKISITAERCERNWSQSRIGKWQLNVAGFVCEKFIIENQITSFFLIQILLAGLCVLHHVLFLEQCFRRIRFGIQLLFDDGVTDWWFYSVGRSGCFLIVTCCTSWIANVEKWFIMSRRRNCLIIKIKPKSKQEEHNNKNQFKSECKSAIAHKVFIRHRRDEATEHTFRAANFLEFVDQKWLGIFSG